MITETQHFEAMNLGQIADKYKVKVRVIKKWLLAFAPDLKRPDRCYIYTPDQVKQIVIACGEFPEK